MAPENEAAQPLRIFCSYAHEDQQYLVELRKHLTGLQRRGLVEAWDDREIRAGSAWDHEIREALKQADVVICLVSEDFTHSEYCWEEEVELARERAKAGDVRLLAVLLKAVHPEAWPFQEFQSLPVDKGRWRPVDSYSPRRGRAYVLILDEIVRIAKERAANGDGAARRDEMASKRPRICGTWPERTSELVGRETLVRRIQDELFAPPGHRVALIGEGGVGKTALAVEFAGQRSDNYEVVAWLHAEESTQLHWEYAELAPAVGLPQTDVETNRAAFRNWLRDNDRWLLVFDNAVTCDAIRPLLPEAARGDVLITSREPVWAELAREVPVTALAEDDAVAYLLDYTGQTDRAAARELATHPDVRCIPRFLEDAGATIKARGIEIREYLDELRARER
jgi:TIR domain/NB-ARC domain